MDFIQVKGQTSKIMTIQELNKFNGKENQQIYLSIKGKIYDVTQGTQYYGPGGSYEMFAGHDITVCVSKMNLDPQLLDNLDFSDFNEKEKETLESWVVYFEKKYSVVGSLQELQQKEQASQSQKGIPGRSASFWSFLWGGK